MDNRSKEKFDLWFWDLYGGLYLGLIVIEVIWLILLWAFKN